MGHLGETGVKGKQRKGERPEIAQHDILGRLCKNKTDTEKLIILRVNDN